MNKLNQEGIDLIKNFEGCMLTCYPDEGGVYTIGYGLTGKLPDGTVIGPGLKISQEQADTYLMDRLNKTALQLDKMLQQELTDEKFSSLVSLGFNIGLGALERSTLFAYVQSGQYGPAAEQFMRWDKGRVKGILVTVSGLRARRAAEKALFQKEA